MAVTLKEFNSIRDYIQQQVEEYIPVDSKAPYIPKVYELCSYEKWMEQRKPKKEKKEQISDSEFDKFWEAFPRYAEFEYKGIKFKSERILKPGTKDSIRTKLHKLLKEDKITVDTLIGALQNEIAIRKEESYKHYRNENKMQYMNNIDTWLNRRVYVAYLDKKVETEQYQSTDIDI